MRGQAKTFPIREYLRRRVSKGGAEPELLPGEIALSEKFGVARDTVRAAVAEIEEGGWIIRLPGRKGMFTNPERRAPELKFIGLMTLCAQEAELDGFSASLLGKIHARLARFKLFYQFVRIPDGFDEDAAFSYLKEQAYDATLWLNVAEEMLPFARKMMDEGIPLVAATTFPPEKWGGPRPGLACSDDAPLIADHVRRCKAEGFKKACALGSDRLFAKRAAAAFAKAGIETGRFIETRLDAPQAEIEKAIAKLDANFVVCDGPGQLAEKLLLALKGVKNAPLVSLNALGERKRLAKLFPSLRVAAPQRACFAKVSDGIAKRAAAALKTLLSEKKSRERKGAASLSAACS